MKKFKDISHLQQEVMRLRIRELELEKLLHKDWLQIKNELKPSSLIRNHLVDKEKNHWLFGLLKKISRKDANQAKPKY